MLVESAVTSNVYKMRLDFSCKKYVWIHVQPYVGSNSDDLLVRTIHNCAVLKLDVSSGPLFEAVIDLFGPLFEAVTDLGLKSCKKQSCLFRKIRKYSFIFFPYVSFLKDCFKSKRDICVPEPSQFRSSTLVILS